MDGSAVVMVEKSSAARNRVNWQSDGQCNVTRSASSGAHKMMDDRNLDGDMVACRNKFDGGRNRVFHVARYWQRRRM
jgi:hypothetical protein